MRPRLQTPAPLLLVFAAGLAGWCLEASGLRFNTSPSIPGGLYRIEPGAFTRGGLVAACLPEAEGTLGRERRYLRRGPCPGGASPVIKRVGARSGDCVEVTTDGVFVNGTRLQDSAPLVDSRGRPLRPIAEGDYELGAGELWLYSSHPSSWDSRFFGPLSRDAILGVVRPIWTRAPVARGRGADFPGPRTP